MCDSNERLGINGVNEIKAHPFFVGVDWKNIRNKKPPYVPDIKSDIDTSNHEKIEENPDEPWYEEDKKKKNRKVTNFLDFQGGCQFLRLRLQSLPRNVASTCGPYLLTAGKCQNSAKTSAYTTKHQLHKNK